MKSQDIINSIQEQDNFSFIENLLHDVIEKLGNTAHSCKLNMTPSTSDLYKMVDNILHQEYSKYLKGVKSPDSKNDINPRFYLVRLKDILPLEGNVRESVRIKKFKDVLLITLTHLIEGLKSLRKQPEKYDWVDIERIIAPFLVLTVKEIE